MRKVVGIGETLLDIVFKGNKPISSTPGGSVLNGLISLSRAVIPVIFISEIGKDHAGLLVRDYLTENNIPTNYIDGFPDGKTPVSLAFLDEQNNAEFSIYKEYPKERLEVPLPPIQQDDIFILSSYYAINPALRERVVEFLDYAKDRKAIIYYDLNFRKSHAHEALRLLPTFMDNYEYADIVRGSEEDFHNLYGQKDIDRIYQEDIRFYCERLIVTRGSREVVLYNKGQKTTYPVPSIETVSTIGAGDNFNAGFLYGLLSNDWRKSDLADLSPSQWEKAISLGIDFASDTCQSLSNSISTEFAKQLYEDKKDF